MDVNQLSQLLMQSDKTSQNQLNQQAAMANLLLQSSQRASNPIVAALAGFLGSNEMQNIAQKQGEVDAAAQKREAAKDIYKIESQERQFAEEKRQFEETLKLQKQKMAQEVNLAHLKLKAEGVSLTEGEKQTDRKFAEDYIDFTAKGGFADVQKSIEQLKEVRNQLASGEVSTGKESYIVPEFARDIIMPKSKAAQERVEEVMQRNLRLVLGAQYTEKEGERVIKRAYNPNLPEAENIARLDRTIQAIEAAAQAKKSSSEYFARNGTLKGWNGSVTMSDIEDAIDGAKKEAPQTGGWSVKVK